MKKIMQPIFYNTKVVMEILQPIGTSFTPKTELKSYNPNLHSLTLILHPLEV